MRIVLDTNILVSALLSPEGKPAQILQRFLRGEFVLCYDERIMYEYEQVLLRPKFHFDPEKVKAILDYIRFVGLETVAPALDIFFIDEYDKKFYEVAKFTGAVLITGNLKHFPSDPIVKSVQEI